MSEIWWRLEQDDNGRWRAVQRSKEQRPGWVPQSKLTSRLRRLHGKKRWKPPKTDAPVDNGPCLSVGRVPAVQNGDPQSASTNKATPTHSPTPQSGFCGSLAAPVHRGGQISTNQRKD